MKSKNKSKFSSVLEIFFRLLKKIYVLQLVLLLVFTFALIKSLPYFFHDHEMPEIYYIEVEDSRPGNVPQDGVSLLFTGINLLHTNVLYINGRKIPILYSEGISYDTCRIVADELLVPLEEEATYQVGKSYPLSIGSAFKSNKLETVIVEEE